MKRDLDSVLDQLRDATVPAAMLDDVERRVWQEIAAREVLTRNSRFRLAFQVASVAAAFVLGILLGVDVADSAQTTQAFLVEDMSLLPMDPGGLLL